MPLPFYISFAALWILVILHSLLLLGVVRLVHQLESKASFGGQQQIGQEIPQFNAVDIRGNRIRSKDLAGQVKALLFVSPDCPSCAVTLGELSALRHKAQGDIVVICRGERNDCAELAARNGLDMTVLIDKDGEIAQLFPMAGVPTAILLDEKGRIQSYGEPKRGEELAAMLAQERGVEPTGVGADDDRGHALNQATSVRVG
jgi:peroxiredoxin